MAPSVVLLDLDGTLADSAPGIVASVEHALAALGVASPGAGALRALMGPPMRQAFHDAFGFDAAETDRAVVAYREYFAARGMFECSLYEGISDLLAELDSACVRLALVTSKPEVFAARILERLGVRGRFAAVCGADLDGRRATKTEIARSVEALMHELVPVRAGAVDRRRYAMLDRGPHPIETGEAPR